MEVPKPKANALDAFDQVVHGLRWTVGNPREVVVADLCEPPPKGRSKSLDLGRHGTVHTVKDEVVQELSCDIRIFGAIELPDAFFDAIGDGDLGMWVTEL